MPKNVEVKAETAMAWKEDFLRICEQEYQTTLRLLKAYPEDKTELRPHEKLRTARELAWGLTNNEPWMLNGIMSGNFMGGERVDAPATMREIIENYERVHSDAISKIKRMNDSDLNKSVDFFVAPKQMGKVRVTDLLGIMVMDQIHHRGQLSVYLRIAGGKVPSIYGPTADENWM
jgi:uncharacterized damage-inducible protein DinB